jgi:hypothetical protein
VTKKRRRGPRPALTDEQVLDARQRYAAPGGPTIGALAREFGVSRPAMGGALRGSTYAHVPMPPELVTKIERPRVPGKAVARNVKSIGDQVQADLQKKERRRKPPRKPVDLRTQPERPRRPRETAPPVKRTPPARKEQRKRREPVKPDAPKVAREAPQAAPPVPQHQAEQAPEPQLASPLRDRYAGSVPSAADARKILRGIGRK